nr:helix-turn-helix transcriptional regulator [Clostridium paraputrificum]
MISVLGENIKKIRLERNFTIQQLSELANVGKATISQIENGNRRSLRSETVEKIAYALNVTTDDLFSSKTDKEYIVSDLLETVDFILQDDEIAIDNIALNQNEKAQFRFAVELAIATIRNNRK